MQTIHTEVSIKASPDAVWKALVVSPAIPVEIRNAIRDRKTGQNLSVPMRSGGRSVTLTVKVLAADPPRQIRWKGYLWIPGLFDGEHSFEIQADTGGIIKLAQRETFTGLLLPFLGKTLRDTKQEFERMNAAVRDAAEQGETETDFLK
jgi:hypothetical protein